MEKSIKYIYESFDWLFNTAIFLIIISISRHDLYLWWHKFLLYFIIIRVFCPRAGLSLQTQAPRLQFCPKNRSSSANSGTKIAVLLGMNRCGRFPLLSTPHSLFSIWTDLKRSENIPGALSWRWEEWIWLTGSSGLHRNSPQGLNNSSIRVFDQIGDLEIWITFRHRQLIIL